MLDFIQKTLTPWLGQQERGVIVCCVARQLFDTNINRLKCSRNKQIDLLTTLLCAKLSGTGSDKFQWPGSVLQPACTLTVTHPFPRNVLQKGSLSELPCYLRWAWLQVSIWFLSQSNINNRCRLFLKKIIYFFYFLCNLCAVLCVSHCLILALWTKTLRGTFIGFKILTMGMAGCWFNSFDKPPQSDALLQIQKVKTLKLCSCLNLYSWTSSLFVTEVVNADRAATFLCELRLCKIQEIKVGHTEIQKRRRLHPQSTALNWHGVAG